MIRLAGNMPTLKPTQNTGIRLPMLLVNFLNSGALLKKNVQLKAERENDDGEREHRHAAPAPPGDGLRRLASLLPAPASPACVRPWRAPGW